MTCAPSPARRRPWLRLARAARCDRGNAAVVFALAMPVIAGGAALSVEGSYDYHVKTKLQAAADAAAYAGALENRAGAGQAAIAAAATGAAASNGWSAADGTIAVANPPASGPATGPNAVEVRLSRKVPRFFTALFTDAPLVATAKAVAIYETGGKACILALSRTAAEAVNITGNAKLTADGCDIASNSVATDAISVWGSADVIAGCAISTGGVEEKGGLDLTNCSKPIVRAPRVRDPFAGIPFSPPTNSGSCGGGVCTPGRFTNLDLKNTVNLQPGVYYVSGDLSINAGAVVTGSGVTFLMGAGSTVKMNGGASVQLSAPTSGAYAGLLFYGDPSGGGGEVTFNGAATSNFTGHLYFPTRAVNYMGSFSGGAGCTHIVADTVKWTGNATVKVDCKDKGMAEIPSREPIRLVL